MTSIRATADADGVLSAAVPLPYLWDLARRVSSERIVASYHRPSDRMHVVFPGWNIDAVQEVLDGVVESTHSGWTGLASWPGLHVPGQGISKDTTALLNEIRGLMLGLSAAEQNRLTSLVCRLKSALAVERLSFERFYESSPDGCITTDSTGLVSHANEAMYRLLQLPSPFLDGKPFLMFFTPLSKAHIAQRLRMLTVGFFEDPFADIQAQLCLPDQCRKTVSMRLIAVDAEDSAHSDIRWLIRDAVRPAAPAME